MIPGSTVAACGLCSKHSGVEMCDGVCVNSSKSRRQLLRLEGKKNEPLLRYEMNTGFLNHFVCTSDSNGTDLLTLKYESNLMAI